MELLRRTLKHLRSPRLANPRRDKRLNRVQLGHDVISPGRNEACDSAQDRYARRDDSYLFHSGDVGRSWVIREDRGKVGGDLGGASHLAPIEAHLAAIRGEERGEVPTAAPVSGIEDGLIQLFYSGLVWRFVRVQSWPSPGEDMVLNRRPDVAPSS